MKRAAGVATVLVTILVVTHPAAAASGAIAVASNNTTDTDFNNAATLQNVTVDGTGTSASVTLINGQTVIIDDAEDGGTTTKSSDWDGWDNTEGTASRLTAQSGTVLNGTQSLELSSQLANPTHSIRPRLAVASNRRK